MHAPTRRIAGAMTGTSIDAVDVALVEVTGRDWDLRATLLAFASHPLGDLAPRLRAAAQGLPLSAAAFAQLAADLGEAVATAIRALPAPAPSLVAVHGQTIHHAPPISLQLVNPWPIARRLGCAVVSDLRAADLAAGGQGAPITPAADFILFADPAEDRAIVNLGGFCNITLLPREGLARLRGFDVCACNQILDAVARESLGAPYDAMGAAALRGTPHPDAAAALRKILAAQRHAARSLGSGDEATEWVRTHAPALAPHDLAATAASAVGSTLRDTLEAEAPHARVFLAGGGVHHAALTRAIGTTETTEALGVHPQAREAVAIALLAALAQDGVHITLPAVTGRTNPIACDGAWIFPNHPA